jgi:1-acyl-sn-glycerol-3-phosphate acyltransferase
VSSRAVHPSAHDQLPRTADVRPVPHCLLGSPLRPLARAVVRRRWRVRVHHADRVPGQGPVIMASNHIGFLDGPLLAIFAPRPVHVLTKIEMFEGRLRRVLVAAGQISLDRYHYDPAAVRAGVRVLRDGRVLGVYPEGRRGGGDFDQFKHGAAYLALVTGAPVVPVTMLGTRPAGGHTDDWAPAGAPVDLVFGRPFAVPAVPWPRTRDLVDATSRRLEEHVRADLRRALDETGLSLPGPLPRGEQEQVGRSA